MHECKNGTRCCGQCKEGKAAEEHDNEKPVPHDSEEVQKEPEPYHFIHTVRSMHY